jgi:1,4-alpha-glucan branching enzyme
MEQRQDEGLFVASLAAPERPDYRLKVDWQGTIVLEDDPYRFGTFLSPEEIARLSDPGSDAVYTKLGPHPISPLGDRRLPVCRLGSERPQGQCGG